MLLNIINMYAILNISSYLLYLVILHFLKYLQQRSCFKRHSNCKNNNKYFYGTNEDSKLLTVSKIMQKRIIDPSTKIFRNILENGSCHLPNDRWIYDFCKIVFQSQLVTFNSSLPYLADVCSLPVSSRWNSNEYATLYCQSWKKA